MEKKSFVPIGERISIQLLNKLDKQDFKAFIHYTRMPGIKQNKKRLDLLQFLAATPVDQWDNPKFNRKILHKVFGGEENFTLLNQAVSETAALLKEFLALRQFRDFADVKYAVLLNDPIIRGHQQAFSKISKDFENHLDATSNRSSEYWRLKALREDLTRKFYAVQRIMKDNSSAYLTYINLFALIERYKYACFSTLYQNVQGRRQLDPEEISELARSAKSSSLLDQPVLRLYSQLFLLITLDDDRMELGAFTDLLLLCEPMLPIEERKEIYLTAAYYINAIVNQGYLTSLEALQGAYRDMFRIFKSLAEDQTDSLYHLLRDGEYMGQWRFLNVIAAALYTGHIDWAASFLEAGLEFVKPEERELTERMGTAALTFYQGEYKKTLNTLNKDQTERLSGFEYYEIYGLRMRAYYMEGEAALFKDALRNIRAKIQRDLKNAENEKIPASRVYAYRSFFETLDLMFDWKHIRGLFPRGTRLADLLEQKLAEYGRTTAHQKWVLEQIESLRP